MRIINKPNEYEYLTNEPLYAKLLPDDGLLLNHLATNFQKTRAYLLALPADKLIYRNAGGKWTIKEVIIHLIDMERIYSYRMLCFARKDQTLLPGYDDELFVLNSGANNRDIFNLLDELEAVRQSTIMLLKNLSNEALLRSGIMNENKASVRALAYHIAGHELHHISIIKERYFQ